MMREAGASTPEANRANAARLDALFNGLWSSPCFTIASIRGVALGGGAGLVACADYVMSRSKGRGSRSRRRSWGSCRRSSDPTSIIALGVRPFADWPCKQAVWTQRKRFAWG